MRSRLRRRGYVWWLTAFALIVVNAPGADAGQDAGLVVEDVIADSPAARAGLQVGDRVVHVNGRPLPSPAALQAAEENTFNVDRVAWGIQRGNEAVTVVTSTGTLGIQVRPPLPPAALTLYEQGRAAQKAERIDDAIVSWTAAARAAQNAGDTGAAAWLHGRLGERREGQRRWKEAIDAHAAAWELLKTGSDGPAQSRTLVALGRCSQNLNDLAAAERWYEQAERIDSAAGYEMWAAADANSLGVAARTRGELTAAHEHYQRALGIRERLAPDSAGLAATFNSLGNLAYDRADLDGAQNYHRRALAILERLAPDSMEVAASVHNLGNVSWTRGDSGAAEGYYQRALGIRTRLAPDSLDLAASFNNLGNIAWSRGEWADAQASYSRSLAIREKLAPNTLVVASSLNNLGNVASDRGDLIAAEDYHRRALLIRERVAPDSLTVATSLANLGHVAASAGDLRAAEDHQRRALAIYERLSPSSVNVAVSLNNLGDVAVRRGDLTLAEEYYRRALALKEQVAPGSLTVATTLNNLGQVIASRGDVTAAQAYHVRALGIRERLAPDSLDVAGSLSDLGGIALARGRASDALPHFTRAVGLIESQRWQVRSADARALLLAKHTASYAGLLRTHIALNDVTAAFATAERARARSLLEILSEGRAEIRQGVDPLLLERERVLQRQLNETANRRTQLLGAPNPNEAAAAVKKELDAQMIQYQGVQDQIRLNSPRYAALTQPQPLSLAEIQQQVLDADTVLLEYALGETASYLFAVTARSIRSFALPPRAEIDAAARRLLGVLTARQPLPRETARQRRDRIVQADADYAAAANALTRIVLTPVAGELADHRLVIVADGALQYVPFGALLEDGQPLMVRHEIVSLPSASVVPVLRRERERRQPADKLVAVLADPVFDAEDPRLKQPVRARAGSPASAAVAPDLARAVRGAGLIDARGALSRLPFTRDEADAILALAPAELATKAVDFTASLATVTSADLNRYRIVHLATHGVLDTEHPELSGIVLSLVDEHGSPQDGFLRLHEVYNLNWSADLVVLSACQTALGKEIKGEGLVGLTRGFMYAGAERVIASLWNVNDSVTAEFMKRFYQGLLVKGLSPAAALRAAQLEMWKRKPWSPPYYWAAFVLQGEWR